MDRRKKRTIRRSGTQQGAKFVHSLIVRAMGRSLNKNEILSDAVPKYLSTIPNVEFETLMRHIDSISIAPILKKEILREASRRAETLLLS